MTKEKSSLIPIKAPVLPESVANGQLLDWHHQTGDFLPRDTVIAEIETDKITMEIVAPQHGILNKTLVDKGATITSEEVIAYLEPSEPPATATTPDSPHSDSPTPPPINPAAHKAIKEHNVVLNEVQSSGKNKRILKEDVLRSIASRERKTPPKPVDSSKNDTSNGDERSENYIPMSRLRSRIAERLLQATNETAMLTSFNELDMHALMDIRTQLAPAQDDSTGVKIGLLPFFVRAVTRALKAFPNINASIDGQTIVQHNYYDISIAVSTDRGLVTPVIRNADRLSLVAIDQHIADFAQRARTGHLELDELSGGCFTITNGGVFGSLLSTPIINPPQTAILGMHAIKKRPVVVDDAICIRPMMYVALSYDHRLIDGKEAVLYLVYIKEQIEKPAQLLMED